MLYRSQALDDRRRFIDNQAMLDRVPTKTADVIKGQLEAALSRWLREDKSRTKKLFAELCQAAVNNERPCTPQAVGAWVKTGRVDKYWIPVISQVLGEEIGNVAKLARPAASVHSAVALRQALGSIAQELLPLDPLSRKQAAPILEALALRPENYEEMAARLEHLLGGLRKEAA